MCAVVAVRVAPQRELRTFGRAAIRLSFRSLTPRWYRGPGDEESRLLITPRDGGDKVGAVHPPSDQRMKVGDEKPRCGLEERGVLLVSTTGAHGTRGAETAARTP